MFFRLIADLDSMLPGNFWRQSGFGKHRETSSYMAVGMTLRRKFSKSTYHDQAVQ
jgi:hypothetical protein